MLFRSIFQASPFQHKTEPVSGVESGWAVMWPPRRESTVDVNSNETVSPSIAVCATALRVLDRSGPLLTRCCRRSGFGLGASVLEMEVNMPHISVE